jgi:hypothetical protein
MSEINEAYLSNIEVKVDSVEIDVIENIDIEEQIVPLVIAPGSVIDKRASYGFEGGVTFSAERDGKSEFKFVVSFYGSAQVSYHGKDIDLGVSLDEPINDYFDFVDEYGDEEEITAERLFELVKETEDYEEEIYFALPSLDSLIQDKK